MNYRTIYQRLIQLAKSKDRAKRSGKHYENHHIVLRSMGGTNRPENMVLLTAKEHFVAHHLLWRIHRNSQTAMAFMNMRINSGRKIGAKEYAACKLAARSVARGLGEKSRDNGKGIFGPERGRMLQDVIKNQRERKVGLFSEKTAADRLGWLAKGRSTVHAQRLGFLSAAPEDRKRYSAEASRKAGEGAAAKAHAKWGADLRRRGLPLDHRPTSKKAAKEEGFSYYWSKICAIHPELEGKRSPRNGCCTACNA